MNSGEFEVVLEGRRVRILPQAQEIHLLDHDGNVTARERIQIAAGSIQGIFSSLSEASDIATIGNMRDHA